MSSTFHLRSSSLIFPNMRAASCVIWSVVFCGFRRVRVFKERFEHLKSA